MTLYVQVIDSKCCGYSPCAEACPEVYKLDQDGYVYVDSSRVPDGLEEQAKRGAAVCPQHAIVVSEQPFE